MAKKLHNSFKYKHLIEAHTLFLGLLLCGFALLTGCNPTNYRTDTDKIAGNIITEKQVQGTGKASKFSIERPSDILRRRLLADQNLPTSSPASLGTDRLKKIEHWPEKNYPAAISDGNIDDINDVNKPITITLMQALQIGALNSFDYQTQKEKVFQSALSLELERHAFRNTFVAQVQNLLSTDTTGDRAVSGTVTSGEIGASRKFQSGAEISTSIAIDLATLLTGGGVSSTGLAGEGSISIPLLRGSGRHIVAEPLTQAERDTIYAIWNFERYKKQFAVDVASKYLAVLRQLDSIKNSEADYRSRMSSAKRSRRLGDAGRIQEIEVDQAVQNELSSRQRWIAATQSYQKQLDSFKTFLGLPPDALIELDPNELKTLSEATHQLISQMNEDDDTPDSGEDPMSELVELLEADYKHAGPYEIQEALAIKLAFENRYDLKTADGQVYDAQRAVVVAADALGAELTFLGSANIGSRRNFSTPDRFNSENSRFVANRGVFSTLLTIDLPLDRKQESLDYRNSFIKLEQAVRNMQAAEDTIKTEIRNTLRDLLEARENMYIQAKAVSVAEKRVKSVNMFLEAGRAQIRDLLEAQDALLEAQNSLTAAVVNYRTAELVIQRDTGVLEVDEKGLWKEYSPGGNQYVKEEIIYN